MQACASKKQACASEKQACASVCKRKASVCKHVQAKSKRVQACASYEQVNWQLLRHDRQVNETLRVCSPVCAHGGCAPLEPCGLCGLTAWSQCIAQRKGSRAGQARDRTRAEAAARRAAGEHGEDPPLDASELRGPPGPYAALWAGSAAARHRRAAAGPAPRVCGDPQPPEAPRRAAGGTPAGGLVSLPNLRPPLYKSTT